MNNRKWIFDLPYKSHCFYIKHCRLRGKDTKISITVSGILI